MKKENKLISALISVVICLMLIVGSVVPVSAEMNVADIIAALMGQGNGASVNIGDVFTDWIEKEMNDESMIDKFVNDLKNGFTGEGNDDEEPDTGDDKEDKVNMYEGEANSVAELFNLTVNELKNGSPAFVKTQIATMDAEIAQSLAGGLGPVTGLVESLVGTKDIFAGVIDGTVSENTVTTKYPHGNDVINNIPLTGKDYVASLTGEDVKDYTITIYKSGAYRMHIDLKDAEGNAAESGLANVFDVTDKAYATIQLGTTSLNIGVMLKYVNCYVECNVNREGHITSYTTHMGVTFMFQQEDGTYSTTMPYLGVDFMEEGIIYTVTTEYGAIDFAVREMGDVDNNGKVTSSDARTVLRYASKLDTISEEDLPYCDVTNDGKVNAADARDILRASSNIIELPSTEDVLGIDSYQKDEAVQKHIDDLLVILQAYSKAKEEEAQKELNDYLNNENGNQQNSPETTTKGEINDTANKVENILGDLENWVDGLLK